MDVQQKITNFRTWMANKRKIRGAVNQQLLIGSRHSCRALGDVLGRRQGRLESDLRYERLPAGRWARGDVQREV